jgi:hypothetical protein
MKSQGDQTKLSKIDRFMCRTVPQEQQPVKATSPQAPVVPSPNQAPVVPSPNQAPSAPAPAQAPSLVTVAQQVATNPATKPSTTSVLSELDILRTLCPEERAEAYNRLVNLLRSDDMFYQTLINLLPRLSSGQKVIVLDFLQN